mmetsp:Transcript_25713/g.61005  ORF Transcript_25713/g.61005 Transcript_25713/m.61005 type:complete len:221 (+) Transcript_25713:402-1064(+)
MHSTTTAPPAAPAITPLVSAESASSPSSLTCLLGGGSSSSDAGVPCGEGGTAGAETTDGVRETTTVGACTTETDSILESTGEDDALRAVLMLPSDSVEATSVAAKLDGTMILKSTLMFPCARRWMVTTFRMTTLAGSAPVNAAIATLKSSRTSSLNSASVTGNWTERTTVVSSPSTTASTRTVVFELSVASKVATVTFEVLSFFVSSGTSAAVSCGLSAI